MVESAALGGGCSLGGEDATLLLLEGDPDIVMRAGGRLRGKVAAWRRRWAGGGF